MTDAPPGTLFVVATPIGNLGDVTLRALEVLRAVPLIACEDTRITRRLLTRNHIDTRLASFHARSGPTRLRELLDHLRGGADLAVTTDAGTPGVSDPGERLVSAWAAEGGRVVPIPGASAVLSAVMATGLAGGRWAFEGFLPRSGRERRERLGRVAADDRSTVIYEAPGRLSATLRDLAAAAGSDRRAAVCRELTKLHEQIVRGSLGELGDRVAAGDIPARGEITIVISGSGTVPAPAGSGPSERSRQAAALDEVESLVAAGVPRGEAVRRVAASSGLSRRSLYRVP